MMTTSIAVKWVLSLFNNVAKCEWESEDVAQAQELCSKRLKKQRGGSMSLLFLLEMGSEPGNLVSIHMDEFRTGSPTQ